MGEFVRTRSKVWWGNDRHQDEDEEEVWGAAVRDCENSVSTNSSSSPESDRGSSGSPSSHKSQDSGFSDSESSSPSGTVPRIPRVTLTEPQDSQEPSGSDQNLQGNVDGFGDDSDRVDSNETAILRNEINENVKNICKDKKLEEETTCKCPTPISLTPCKPSFTPTKSFLSRYPSDNVDQASEHSETAPNTPRSSRTKNLDFREELSYMKIVKNGIKIFSKELLLTKNDLEKSRSKSRTLDRTGNRSLEECKLRRSLRIPEDLSRSIVARLNRTDPTFEQSCQADTSSESSNRTEQETARYLGNLGQNTDASTWSIPGPPNHCSTPKKTKPCPIPKTPELDNISRRKYSQQHESNTIKDPPLKQWLSELSAIYEPECMTTLQSKSLSADITQQVTIMSAVTTEAVRSLQFRTKLISNEFTKLYRKVDSCQLEHAGPLVQSLVGHVMEFLDTYKIRHSDEHDLLSACERLRTAAMMPKPDRENLTLCTMDLGKEFSQSVDMLLLRQIKVLVSIFEETTSPVVILTALSSLTSLGLDGRHLSRLVARCNDGIRSLLTLCIDSRNTSIRTAALRALATVCCTTHTIRQLEKAGGVEILGDILQDEKRCESEITEAVSVIVQITAPWVEDNHSVLGLTQLLTPLVSSLTRMISNTSSGTTLLLCAAALCHLSQLEPQCVWVMLENSTAGTVLLAIRKQGPFATVFLKEQAAGLLANMAAVPEVRPHLAEHRAVVALLCFLQVRHSPLQRHGEIAAMERLHHKSAIALSRICSDPSVAGQVIELQGVKRLVSLCREERERNNSDGVLVACLAALRKIVANCGTKCVEEFNALELVEPRLLDSFLIYSSKQESYV